MVHSCQTESILLPSPFFRNFCFFSLARGYKVLRAERTEKSGKALPHSSHRGLQCKEQVGSSGSDSSPPLSSLSMGGVGADNHCAFFIPGMTPIWTRHGCLSSPLNSSWDWERREAAAPPAFSILELPWSWEGAGNISPWLTRSQMVESIQAFILPGEMNPGKNLYQSTRGLFSPRNQSSCFWRNCVNTCTLMVSTASAVILPLEMYPVHGQWGRAKVGSKGFRSGEGTESGKEGKTELEVGRTERERIWEQEKLDWKDELWERMRTGPSQGGREGKTVYG